MVTENKKLQNNIHPLQEESFKSIDNISDGELVYFGKNSEKKKEIEKIIENERKEGRHKKGTWITLFEYMDPAQKVFKIFQIIFIVNIPLSILISFVLGFVGLIGDAVFYNPGPNTLGHPVPMMAAFGFILGIMVAVTTTTLLLVCVIVSYIISKWRSSHKKKDTE